MFVKNCWYTAAWASELRDDLLVRRIADEPIVFYRLASGAPVALLDRCPHRFAPLSRGRKAGDQIRCGYHGLTFDADGKCVANPLGNGDIPKTATVKAFPTAERHGFIWVWPGNPEKANTALIPDLSGVAPSSREHYSENLIYVRADYRLAIDNLMDLSHVVFLHEETIAPVTPELQNAQLQVSQNDGRIKALFEMKNVALGDGSRRDQWLETEWSVPGVIVLTLTQAEPGCSRAADEIRALHIITPETERTCHYFFGSAGAVDNRTQLIRDPFTDEDEPMLAACQDNMGSEEFWSLSPVISQNDAAAIQVRRQLEKMIRDEKLI